MTLQSYWEPRTNLWPYSEVLQNLRRGEIVLARNKPNRRPVDPKPAGTGLDLTRLTNLVALLLVKGEDQNEKIRTLKAAGYTPNEIASFLGITANAVNVALHRMRNRGG